MFVAHLVSVLLGNARGVASLPGDGFQSYHGCRRSLQLLEKFSSFSKQFS